MGFLYVWALMILAIGFIALNIWLIMDSLFHHVDETRATKSKAQKTKPPSGLSAVGS